MTDFTARGQTVPPLHPFDEALRLSAIDEDRFAGATNPAYRNMVGPFGGLTAATLLSALLQHPKRLGDPVAFTVNFAAPVPDGEFTIRTRLIQSGRSVQHWSAELAAKDAQAGSASTTATAVFGTRRQTWGHRPLEAPALPAPLELAQSPRPEAIRWLERYDRRSLDERDSPLGKAWLSDDPPRLIDFASLVAYCDAFTPWIFVTRGHRTPIGTVSLNTFFHVSTSELDGLARSLAKSRYRTNIIHEGFFDQEGELWSPCDRLLATTRQMVWFRH